MIYYKVSSFEYVTVGLMILCGRSFKREMLKVIRVVGEIAYNIH